MSKAIQGSLLKPKFFDSNMYRLLRKLYFHLSPHRRKQMIPILALMILSAISDVMSLGLVAPFLGVLVAPEKVLNTNLGSFLSNTLGIASSSQLILSITVVFIITSAIAGTLRMLQLWATTKYTFACGSELSIEVYRKTLYQPYQVHISRNSSEVISAVVDKVNHVIFWIMQPALTLVSNFVMFIFMTLALFWIDPWIASISVLGFGSVYVAITLYVKSTLKKNSQTTDSKQTLAIKALQEGIGGIRDVLLDGTQEVYSEIYEKADRPLRKAHASNVFIGSSPRYAMEAVGMMLIASLAYFLYVEQGSISSAIPILGALAIGAQRILPALQQIFFSATSILSGEAILQKVLELSDQELVGIKTNNQNRMEFVNSIEIKNLDFSYAQQGHSQVLRNFNLSIEKGKRIGIIGQSGSGKSTLLDIIMGLLVPTEGSLEIDGIPITENNVRSWQKNIAHVPQSIYLSDASFAENIAFGVSKNEIDLEKVKIAAEKAKIADFIESRPQNYSGNCGERGVRLSGGQRQRIGIARALYKNASVIVFDEATSALDSETERDVMDAINSLSRDLTLIIVAHRTSTLQGCDIIFDMSRQV